MPAEANMFGTIVQGELDRIARDADAARELDAQYPQYKMSSRWHKLWLFIRLLDAGWAYFEVLRVLALGDDDPDGWVTTRDLVGQLGWGSGRLSRASRLLDEAIHNGRAERRRSSNKLSWHYRIDQAS